MDVVGVGVDYRYFLASGAQSFLPQSLHGVVIAVGALLSVLYQVKGVDGPDGKLPGNAFRDPVHICVVVPTETPVGRNHQESKGKLF